MSKVSGSWTGFSSSSGSGQSSPRSETNQSWVGKRSQPIFAQTRTSTQSSTPQPGANNQPTAVSILPPVNQLPRDLASLSYEEAQALGYGGGGRTSSSLGTSDFVLGPQDGMGVLPGFMDGVTVNGTTIGGGGALADAGIAPTQVPEPTPSPRTQLVKAIMLGAGGRSNPSSPKLY